MTPLKTCTPLQLTWMTLMLSPVSWASCSLMCRVGFGVAANAAFSVSNCLALIVVRGPLRLAPLTGIPVPLSLSRPSKLVSWLLLLFMMFDASLARSRSSGVVAGMTLSDGDVTSDSASRSLRSSVLGLSGGELESWLERAVLQEPGGLLKWSLSGSSGRLTVARRKQKHQH